MGHFAPHLIIGILSNLDRILAKERKKMREKVDRSEERRKKGLRKTRQKLSLESIPVKIKMRGVFLGREKRIWVLEALSFAKKRENLQGNLQPFFFISERFLKS